jgi:hypothetical protein
MIRKSLVSILLVSLISSLLYSGEVDLLVNKLMEKGVISGGEAQQILTLSKENLRTDLAKGKAATAPKWTQMIKLNGDLRLRAQREDNGGYWRDRARMRFRLKGIANVKQGLKVGFGLATGGADPRSTNQTLEGNFSTKAINLDYAFAKYICPKTGMITMGGKFPNKKLIWKPSDLLWDSDINLEGIGLSKKVCIDDVSWFFNAGFLVLEHVKKVGNPSMAVFQPGVTFKVSDISKMTLAASLYNFDKAKGNLYATYAGSNSLDNAGNLMYDYNCMSAAAQICFKNLIFQKMSFFAEYVTNPDPDESNEGFLGGVKFGKKKVKCFGDWQMKAMYRELQKDAWLDIFPDSDARGGKTDNQGMEIALKIGLTKKTYLGIDYYYIGQVGEDNKRSLTQVDIGIKF